MRKLTCRYPEASLEHLLVAEGKVWDQPTLAQTILGSCVAVALHSPQLRVGAMFHALLPSWKDYEANGVGMNPYRYVDAGVEALLNEMKRRGAKPERLQCKVFGGAQALFSGEQSVGTRNVSRAFEVLARHRVRVLSSNVGGSCGRKVFFVAHTGEIFMKLLNSCAENKTQQSEG